MAIIIIAFVTVITVCNSGIRLANALPHVHYKERMGYVEPYSSIQDDNELLISFVVSKYLKYI